MNTIGQQFSSPGLLSPARYLGQMTSGPSVEDVDPSRLRTVLIALAANLLVAVAKSIAALVTGSASMVAEAVHSWADAGNEIFLIVANRRSVRQRDDSHPYGYGREAYFWSLLAALGLFIVGAVISVMHGVQQLFSTESSTNYGVAYVVLAIAAVLEGASLAQSIVQLRRHTSAYSRNSFDYALNGSNTTLRAVLAEDAAALIGLAIAAIGIVLHEVTGVAAYDAIGSILIGALLGVVAVVLIDRNRQYLVGSSPPARFRSEVGKTLLARSEIERVTYIHLEFAGPGRLYLVAAVDLLGDGPEDQVAEKLRGIERSIGESVFIETAVLTLSVSDEPSLEF